jgi:hypothetical protein
MTTLQSAILDALEAAGPERKADLFWSALTRRVSPVDAYEAEQELKGLFSNRRAA